MPKSFTSTFALFRGVAYGVLFLSFWLYWIPMALSGGRPWQVDWNALAPLQILGTILMFAGLVIIVSCVIAFGTQGSGTPAPFDPPRFLVRNWLYRHVRNPMYIGLGFLLLGEALLFPAQRRMILTMMAVVFAALQLFIVFYEEPNLQRLFGESYEAYRRQVPRWLPRLTPYRP